MAKRTLGLLLTIVFTFSLIGCGAQSKETVEEPVEANVTEDVDEIIKEEPVSEENTQTDVEEEVPEIEPNVDLDADMSNPRVTIAKHSCENKEGDNTRFSGKYPEITLSNEMSTKYPKLKDMIDSKNDEWKKEVDDSFSYVLSQIEEASDDDKDYFYNMNHDIYASVDRTDGVLFTISTYNEAFTGGAHPSHWYENFNIDPNSGEIVKLSDVINDKDKFVKLLIDKLDEQKISYDLQDKIDNQLKDKIDKDNFTWSITGDGLLISFSDYEITSYADGDPEILIDGDDLARVVKPQYIMTNSQDMSKIVKEKELSTEMLKK